MATASRKWSRASISDGPVNGEAYSAAEQLIGADPPSSRKCRRVLPLAGLARESTGARAGGQRDSSPLGALCAVSYRRSE